MKRLRVLTLNIWNRQGPYERRLPMIRRGIEGLAPDVVGLQEVISHDGRTQADDIRDGLGVHYESAFGPAHDLGGGVLFGNAVLSRWPITRKAVFQLPTGGGDEHRALVLAEIASPHGKLPVFVTHLNWKLHHGSVRESQVVAIAEHVTREVPVGTTLPPIVVGDFNAQPDSDEIRFLKGLHSIDGRSVYFGDAFDQVGEGSGVTFDPRNNPFAGQTHEYPRRIDYVFVRGPDTAVRGKPLAARVVMQEVEDGVAASDHYGVLAEISV